MLITVEAGRQWKIICPLFTIWETAVTVVEADKNALAFLLGECAGIPLIYAQGHIRILVADATCAPRDEKGKKTSLLDS